VRNEALPSLFVTIIPMSYLDEFGKVLAMKDTEVKDPWVVLESSRFPGRIVSTL